jgi:hypothetical protein
VEILEGVLKIHRVYFHCILLTRLYKHVSDRVWELKDASGVCFRAFWENY